jgi:hypothetical protein
VVRGSPAVRRGSLGSIPVRRPRSRDAQPAFSLGALDRLDRLIEVFPARSRWPRQLALVRECRADDYGLGLECVRRTRTLGPKMHIRRQTDIDAVLASLGAAQAFAAADHDAIARHARYPREGHLYV